MESYDALIVGAGFGGIYQLYSLQKLGLNVRLIDRCVDVGGVWQWNRYPGAMSDTHSTVYRYSWDKEDLMTYPFTDNYLYRDEIVAYLSHIVERHNLRKHMEFNLEVTSAEFHEDDGTWTVHAGDKFIKARYLITALGHFTQVNWPSILGQDAYKGELYHTARFPEHYDFKGKRVGVIGNGSTGVQVIVDIAKDVGSLISFQRTPQYSVPAGRRPVTAEDRAKINREWDEIWKQVQNTTTACEFVEPKISAMDVSAEERDRIYQEAWDYGNNLQFLRGTFNDLVSNKASNITACEFIRKKIAETVKDPVKREKLTPTDIWNRRPICDAGYFEQFNRDNVDVVMVKDNPIVKLTQTGLELADGTRYDLDVIIFATGFDAIDGSYRQIKFIGRNGITLDQHWKDGPTSYFGVGISEFPNLFMISGPQSIISNLPPALESYVEFITDLLATAEERRKQGGNLQKIIVETEPEAERDWNELCIRLGKGNLYMTAKSSFISGTNVEGKKGSTIFFMGGYKSLRERLNNCIKEGYKGFRIAEY
ncbi:hypothetical protein AYL99_00178 [Fonsecaea erecta]|uniref:Cyclohexanone monooxygenase n=1 Tax=Fonsecaea erecta TaxID=1367422 RepID=A0A178ZXR8_9EURO|nr:hypothetical protein AYL99_00178 [Fonsecaea erecta]OAP64206.1 hypothetical protein AYL99_00178 [Fonsecaea erecta]